MFISRFCVFIVLTWKTVLICRKHTLKQLGVLGHRMGNLLSDDSGTQKCSAQHFQLFCKFNTD